MSGNDFVPASVVSATENCIVTREVRMKLWQLGGIVALLVGVGAAQERAQEKKAEKCSMAGICCPKDGKCTGECRAICDRAGETLKAARKMAGDKMQAKYN